MPLAGGTRFGPYEIVAPARRWRHGRGLQSSRYSPDRTVAIKVLPSHIADSRGSARDSSAKRVRSSLKHPHICTLYDIGRETVFVFMVMEHLEGETLADVSSHGPLPSTRL